MSLLPANDPVVSKTNYVYNKRTLVYNDTQDKSFAYSGDEITLSKDLLTTPIHTQLTPDGFTRGSANVSFVQLYENKEKTQAIVYDALNPATLLDVNDTIRMKNGSNSITIDENNITHSATAGNDLAISSNQNITIAGDNIDFDATGRLLIPNPLTTNNHLDYNAGKLTINNVSVGGTANPLLVLQNRNNTAGSVSIETYKNKATGAQNDTIAGWSMYANDFSGNKVEFARINSTITNSSVGGGNDGAVNIWASVNGTISNVFTFNGADNENNTFRPLDLTGNDLKTSSGNMLIQSTSSTGTGNITINSKGSIALTSVADDIDLTSNTTISAQKTLSLSKSATIVSSQVLNGESIVNSDLTNSITATLDTTKLTILDTPNNSFSQLNNVELELTDNTNNKSITIDNTSSTQNRIDLFKNDGGGISSQVAITDATSNQILSLSHTDNANNKTIAFSNARSGNTRLEFQNTIDANGFDIISSKSLNLISNDAGGTSVLQSANGVQITGDNTIAMNTNTGADTISFQTNNLTFTGAGLQSNTSSGNSGEHLVITLNGNQYKIKLELV